jgi:hypothetical protein
VALTLEGRRTLHIESNDPILAHQAFAWLQKTYGVVATPTLSAHTTARATTGTETPVPQEHPICPIHQLPMTWQNGRTGYFWSCHARLPNGRWCSFKPRGRAAA